MLPTSAPSHGVLYSRCYYIGVHRRAARPGRTSTAARHRRRMHDARRLRPGSACYSDGSCSKGYLKPFRRQTAMGEDSYPLYRRRSPEDGGQTYAKYVRGQQTQYDNHWVVPYQRLPAAALQRPHQRRVLRVGQGREVFVQVHFQGSRRAVVAMAALVSAKSQQSNTSKISVNTLVTTYVACAFALQTFPSSWSPMD